MENLEIIELIMQKVTVKYIQRDCKKLLKHFSKKSSKDIGIVAELTTLLYAFGMYEIWYLLEIIRYGPMS